MSTEENGLFSHEVHFGVLQMGRHFSMPFFWTKDIGEQKRILSWMAIRIVHGSSAYFQKSTFKSLPNKRSHNIRQDLYSGSCTRKLSTLCWSNMGNSVWISGENCCEIKSTNLIDQQLQEL